MKKKLLFVALYFLAAMITEQTIMMLFCIDMSSIKGNWKGVFIIQELAN